MVDRILALVLPAVRLRWLLHRRTEQRAVLTSFGRANRIPGQTTLERPGVGGAAARRARPLRLPAGRVIARRLLEAALAAHPQDVDRDAHDVDRVRSRDARRERGGQILEAVTKDQLNIGLTGSSVRASPSATSTRTSSACGTRWRTSWGTSPPSCATASRTSGARGPGGAAGPTSSRRSRSTTCAGTCAISTRT